jgi:hypothetical protein
LKLRRCLRDNSYRWCASVSKEVLQRHSYCLDITRSDAEGGCGETDLCDEVAELVDIEVHEPEYELALAISVMW